MFSLINELCSFLNKNVSFLWFSGSDLLASLTSPFDRKLKSLLSATNTTVEAVTDASAEEKLISPSITRSSTQESDKITQKSNKLEETDKLLLCSSNGKKEVPQSSKTASSQAERVIVRSTTTATSTALFRDPSLHRRRSASVDPEGQRKVSRFWGIDLVCN